jgi:hypothetical protein
MYRKELLRLFGRYNIRLNLNIIRVSNLAQWYLIEVNMKCKYVITSIPQQLAILDLMEKAFSKRCRTLENNGKTNTFIKIYLIELNLL